MNIAFCIATRQWGGVKTLFLEFAEELHKRGHAIFFYARDTFFVEEIRKRKFFVKEVSFVASYSPITIALFYKEFKEHSIDIVVGNVGKDITTAGIAARVLGIGVLQTIGAGKDIRDSFSAKIKDILVRPCYFTPSSFIKKDLLGRVSFIKSQDVYVVESGKYPRCVREGVNRPLSLITTGRIVKSKGLGNILEALMLLKQEGYSFTWDSYGEGEDLEEFQHKTEELDLLGSVKWNNFSNKISEKLREADIFVMASESEGLPNAMLEAFSEGLVCVCTDVGGIPEAFPEECKDLLVAQSEGVRALFSVLEKVFLMEDEEIIRRKGSFLKRCEDRFNMKDKGKEMEEVLLNCLQKK
ncbi:MAG: glycosyltransferase family 4 protein [Desulfovibrionaceae bacterium]